MMVTWLRRFSGRGLASLLFTLGFSAGVAQAETVLRIAPGADLTAFDPTGPAATQTYIHGLIVYDMLFSLDENLHVQPQMIDSETVSLDRLDYAMRLRPGLIFHDGSPVTARDVVASLKRWMGLDIVGRTMATDVSTLEVVDGQTFRITLKRAFPVEQALANSGSGLPVIMREIEASAGPFNQNTRIIGSGPFRFVASAWNPGDKIIYERFPGYVPRNEPPDGLAGGKIAKVDKLEFHVIPDAATKSAALQTGEVDFIDQLPFDQAEIMAARKDITVSTLTKTFNPFFMRPNTLYPPFDNVRRWHWRSTKRTTWRLRSSGRNGANPANRSLFAVARTASPMARNPTRNPIWRAHVNCWWKVVTKVSRLS
jgi:peptide/nickel transport system substrate-binding protein